MCIIAFMNRFEELKKIVKEAGVIVKNGYAKTVDVDKKSATELVTKYDKEVEELLIGQIAPLYKEYEIVGEESFKGGKLPEKVIFIDPIDGTTNFVHKFPHLGISVGIWSSGEAEEAIVYNPILEEFFYAQKGQGAFCNEQKLQVTSEESLQNSIIATGFPYVKHEMGAEYWWVINSMQKLLPKIRDIRRLGAAAFDLCYLAQGKLNGFYEVNLQPWDVAAGILIVQEAGGSVSNLRGGKYSLENNIIVASNGKIQSQLLENLAEF